VWAFTYSKKDALLEWRKQCSVFRVHAKTKSNRTGTLVTYSDLQFYSHKDILTLWNIIFLEQLTYNSHFMEPKFPYILITSSPFNTNGTAIVVKASHSMTTRILSPQTSELRSEADHLPPSSDEVNKWAIYLLLFLAFVLCTGTNVTVQCTEHLYMTHLTIL